MRSTPTMVGLSLILESFVNTERSFIDSPDMILAPWIGRIAAPQEARDGVQVEKVRQGGIGKD